MPEMDYSKLRGRIAECGITQKTLAERQALAKVSFARRCPGVMLSSKRRLWQSVVSCALI